MNLDSAGKVAFNLDPSSGLASGAPWAGSRAREGTCCCLQDRDCEFTGVAQYLGSGAVVRSTCRVLRLQFSCRCSVTMSHYVVFNL